MKSLKSFKNDTSFEQGMIRVYFVSVRKNHDLVSKYLTYLSIDEREKAARFKFEIDGERFVIARAVLRILSGNFLNINPKEIQFTYGEQGKPDFFPKQRLNFNVSHSEDMIVIGFVQDEEIGIDVELVKADFDPVKLATSFFSPAEIESLREKPRSEMDRAFFRCWTRKESFVKAIGSGLSFPLDKFSVSTDRDDEAELLNTDWDFSERLNWSLFSFVPEAQYIGAIAVRNKLSRVKYFDWDVLRTRTKPTSNNLGLDF